MKLLLIGAITNSEATYKDGVRRRFGGGVMYGARVAAKLGIDTTVITIGADDIEGGVEELKESGVNVLKINRSASNNFSNDYTGEERKMYVRSFIDLPIKPEELPSDIGNYDCVILCPILNEMSPGMLDAFSENQTILLDPQGFTRKLGEKNENGLHPVIQTNWENYREFQRVNVLKISEEDLSEISLDGSEEEKAKILSDAGFKVVVVTRGGKPTIVVSENNIEEVPTENVEVKDTAGAGDTFGVAFIYKYSITKDAILSAKFANICSGLKVAGEEISVSTIEEKLH